LIFVDRVFRHDSHVDSTETTDNTIIAINHLVILREGFNFSKYEQKGS
jgi:hypothetical protein